MAWNEMYDVVEKITFALGFDFQFCVFFHFQFAHLSV